jgi:hypothetical protein
MSIDNRQPSMNGSALLSGNGRNQSRKLSLKELHSISLARLLNNELLKSLFPPRRVMNAPCVIIACFPEIDAIGLRCSSNITNSFPC